MSSHQLTPNQTPPDSKPSAQIFDLPEELLQAITTHLDTRSSVHLSLTSSSLRAAAEMQVWSSLSIPPKELMFDTPIFDTNGIPIIASPTVKLSSNLYSKAIDRIVGMLDRAEWRAGMVKKLIVPMVDELPADIVTLLEKVSSSLCDLRIDLVCPAVVPDRSTRHLPLYEIFSSISDPLPMLSKVELWVKTDTEKTLVNLLKAAPNVEHLTIHAREYLPKASAASSSLFDRTKLTTLMWYMPACRPEIAAQLITASPDLRKLALIDNMFDWTPTLGIDPLVKAISSLELLTTLEVPFTALREMGTRTGGLEELRHLSVIWSTQGISSAQRNRTNVIPSLPSLKTYQFDVSPYASHQPYNHHSDLFPHFESLRLLASLPLQAYHDAPQLELIYCPSALDFQETTFPPKVPSWKDHSFQGIVIYSFSRHARTSDTEAKEVSDDLVHVRSHVSTGDVQCKQERCIVCCMGWEDKAWWKGFELPIKVLDAAYMAGGVQLCRMDPARGMEMGKAGWDVLKYWSDTKVW